VATIVKCLRNGGTFIYLGAAATHAFGTRVLTQKDEKNI
jgi:hypothetical protein